MDGPLLPKPATTEGSHTEAEKQTENQQLLTQKVAELGKVTDRLGKGIDQGIIETVALLQLYGVNTIQSCEGHADHGTGAPYIDVGAQGTEKESQELYAMLDTKQQRGWRGRLLSVVTAFDGGQILTKYGDRMLKKREALMAKHEKEIAVVRKLLDAFYQDRQVDPNVQLFIDAYFWDGQGRVRPREADELEERIRKGEVTAAEREQKLQVYQTEMREFTDFVKNHFLTNDNSQLR
jgi:hypothetical protein